MQNIINFSFTLKDIGFLVLWGLVSVILFYVIILLKSLYTTMKKVNAIVSSNQGNINKILNEAPELTKNINTISHEVGDSMIKFRGTIDNVSQTSESITETINDNETITKQLTSFFHTVNTLKILANKITSK